MANEDRDTELLLITLLILSMGEDYDPRLSERLYSRIVRRLERSRFEDPELRGLLERLLFDRPPFRRRFRDADFLLERAEAAVRSSAELGRQLSDIVASQNAIQTLLANQEDSARLVHDFGPSVEPSRLASELVRRVEAIKRHTVQLEAICLSTILFVVLPQFQQALSQLVGPTAAFLLPFPFLSAIAWLAPVVNPEDSIRSRIKWGLTGLGAGATLGGGIAGAFTLGIGAPVGALLGGAAGFVSGFVAGPSLDGSKPVFTQGEAREYLMTKRQRHPGLDFTHVVDATEHPPNGKIKPIPMFQSDGVIKCAKEDVDKWLTSTPWK